MVNCSRNCYRGGFYFLLFTYSNFLLSRKITISLEISGVIPILWSLCKRPLDQTRLKASSTSKKTAVVFSPWLTWMHSWLSYQKIWSPLIFSNCIVYFTYQWKLKLSKSRVRPNTLYVRVSVIAQITVVINFTVWSTVELMWPKNSPKTPNQTPLCCYNCREHTPSTIGDVPIICTSPQ